MYAARNYLNIEQFTDTTDLTFDSGNLYTKKQQLSTLKAGIYFKPTSIQNTITKVPFTTIVNTRSPTSVISAQTLAA